MIRHLCFHGVGTCVREREPGEARYWVTTETFLRTLDAVREQDGLLISFDDGNRSDVEIALPALEERGMRATFFALAGRLDDPTSLSPGDLESLRRAGMGVGSHGWAHVPWRGLSPEDAHRELVEARTVLAEASGGPIEAAALPLGRYDRQLLQRLRKSAYRVVYTSDRFPARPSAWLQPRYSATSTDTPESIRAVLSRRAGFHEARNFAASLVKSVR